MCMFLPTIQTLTTIIPHPLPLLPFSPVSDGQDPLALVLPRAEDGPIEET
jgi:hypothetical protein